jgi:hypothetical protein
MMAGVGGSGISSSSFSSSSSSHPGGVSLTTASMSRRRSNSIGSASAIRGTSAVENNNVRFLKSYTSILN